MANVKEFLAKVVKPNIVSVENEDGVKVVRLSVGKDAAEEVGFKKNEVLNCQNILRNRGYVIRFKRKGRASSIDVDDIESILFGGEDVDDVTEVETETEPVRRRRRRG